MSLTKREFCKQVYLKLVQKYGFEAFKPIPQNENDSYTVLYAEMFSINLHNAYREIDNLMVLLGHMRIVISPNHWGMDRYLVPPKTLEEATESEILTGLL